MMQSRQLKHFKDNVGQINHFLITIFIGLEGVRLGKVEKEDSFNTIWNPKNIESSVNRSRIFATKAALVWLIDNIDFYFFNINKYPILVQDATFSNAIMESRGIFPKYEKIIQELNLSNNIKSSFVDLAIQWRNNIVHHNANNNIFQSSRAILKKNSDFLHKNYCNLNIFDMLEHFDKRSYPRFKEITTLIKVCIEFVTEFLYALKDLDFSKSFFFILLSLMHHYFH